MEINKYKIGPVIKEIRTARKITQKELHYKSGLSINYLSLLENGKRGIGFDKLNKLAIILGIPAHLFVILATEIPTKKCGLKSRFLKNIQELSRLAITLYSSG
jgi:transcriptional regulator with XRE-family HTH domain